MMKLLMLGCLPVLLACAPPLAAARSAEKVMAGFIAPPEFTLKKETKEHGYAIFSDMVLRGWVDANGVYLVLRFESSTIIPSHSIAAQAGNLVEKYRKFYPKESQDLAQVYTVNRKSWVLIRSRSLTAPVETLRIIIFTELNGLAAQMELFGPKSQAEQMGRYLKFIVERNSGVPHTGD